MDMAAVRVIRQQSYEAIYALLKQAMVEKKPVSAVYRERRRTLCPYVLGRTKDDRLQVLCYQSGGESRSGLGHKGSDENWRCIAIEKLTEVKLTEERWQSPASRSRPQSCVSKVEFEVLMSGGVAQSATAP